MSTADNRGHADSDTIQPQYHDVSRSPIVDAMSVHGDATTKEMMGPHANEKPVISSTDSDLKTTIPSGQYVDAESQDHVGSIDREDQQPAERYSWGWFYGFGRPYIHAAIWVLFTVWWIYGALIHHRHDHLGWLKPTLVYIAICLRILFCYVPTSIVMRPAKMVWRHTVHWGYSMIPQKLHKPLAAIGTLGVFLLGSMIPEEIGENTRASRAISIFGLLVMVFILTATSRDWRKIPWHTVIGGMLTQFVIAVFVLKTKAGYDIFSFVSEMARTLLGFAKDGVEFLTDETVTAKTWFLTGVVPPIIFFVALVQLCYHLGFIQWFIGKFAVFFFWTLRVSGAEAVVAAATPFIGQGESAMLIRPFVPHLTLAEIHQIMTCGFATIAGSVLVAYIGLGLNAQALVSSCIMSIPASLAVSKMRFPETEETLTSGRVVVPEDDEHKASNALHAFANGAWLGIKIAGMIVATLLCIIAIVAFANGLLGWWGKYWGLMGQDEKHPLLSLQLILGYLMYPVAWLLGVPKKDLRPVGELIGIKVITNEFVAFFSLTNDEPYKSMSPRSKLIATYAVCGFGNIGSLGTQIGVLSQLAPGRAGDVSKVALSALFSGVLSTLTSASVAGMLYDGK
ncbi:Na+ dependent nucleoside transporter C-terminus-domain-containing protein [Copromyces sp. CBS 386.78]|nr:Na+ dependent nucleoside transporter C-terminus-domain-containing protein [Copromyces sp. CBS 386.78]